MRAGDVWPSVVCTLRSHPHLTIADNGIENDGACAIGRALEANELLTTLSLGCMSCGEDGWSVHVGGIFYNVGCRFGAC